MISVWPCSCRKSYSRLAASFSLTLLNMLWYLAAMPVIYRNRVKHDDLHVRTDEMSTSHPWHGGFIDFPGTWHGGFIDFPGTRRIK